MSALPHRRFRISPLIRRNERTAPGRCRGAGMRRQRGSAVQSVPDFEKWNVNGIGRAAFGAGGSIGAEADLAQRR
jgi:hypothetical protein